MAEQTAVDYLFERLFDTPKDKFEWYAILEQAKQMEKEQIIDAILNNQNGLLRRKTIIEAEQYYNETYNP